MDNSIYITLTRQLALFRDLDATANNIANANTTGYNAEHIQFAPMSPRTSTRRLATRWPFDQRRFLPQYRTGPLTQNHRQPARRRHSGRRLFHGRNAAWHALHPRRQFPDGRRRHAGNGGRLSGARQFQPAYRIRRKHQHHRCRQRRQYQSQRRGFRQFRHRAVRQPAIAGTLKRQHVFKSDVAPQTATTASASYRARSKDRTCSRLWSSRI